MSAVRQATLSGQAIDHSTGTLYKVNCPVCGREQWHYRGIVRCFFCDVKLSVSTFKIVRNSAPDKTPEIGG